MRTFRWLLPLILLCTLLTVPQAIGEDVLTFPEALTRIEEEAFFGCRSIEKVVLHEGVTCIGPRAFAHSGLTEITLPASVTSIAEDAFDGCDEGLTIWAEEGTYAWNWASSHGYFDLAAFIIDLPSGRTQIDVTEPYQIPYHTVPANAKVNLSWQCWQAELVRIDENGLVTPLQAGYADINVYNGGAYIASLTLEVTGEFYTSEGLQYKLTADGTGWRVVGVEGDPGRITIPAAHNGLPVVAFEPGAFKDCTHLTDIALEDGHTVLYIENSALYADLPEKTLLCYPGHHAPGTNYYITPGTKAIAAYAFAQCRLDILTVPEGLVRIGDCAFYSIQFQLGVYLPDSVTEFGSALFQSQQSNGYFYVSSWESPGAVYASKYSIPCGVIIQRTPEPTMAPTPTPAPTPAPSVPPVDESRIAVYDELQWIQPDAAIIRCTYNLSALEGDDVSEVRMAIEDQWRDLQYYDTAQQTGLYGAGYTGQSAVLRGYDEDGQVVGMKVISGDFTFSFDGARTLGIAGGKDTRLTVLPTKPVFVSQPGRYPIQHDQWHAALNGNIYQYFILEMPRGMASLDFPDYLNNLSCAQEYVTTGRATDESQDYLSGYVIVRCCTLDGTRADQMDVVTLVFDYMEQLVSNADFSCYASSLPTRSDGLGEAIYKVYQATRAEMLTGHYPAELPIQRVQVRLNGSYPGAFMRIVKLDSFFFEYDDSDVSPLSHELTHAIDQGLTNADFLPSPWMEGRAEWISLAICRDWGVPYGSNDYPSGKGLDWSFLSAADRADFARFYYTSSNRYTTYTIGYYFYDFLIETYGSSVGAEVMRSVAQASFDGTDSAAIFKQCVESVTEPGVFQRFIDDVVTPSGT